ncbi:pseudouridine synthase [Curvibacter sp. APW13]|uniref:pseudouridine synthase n=1 Tax=Curvibacter sp. APW13 TaxID=3077236 RepID=UPI0028DF85DC|nr:pseudouridine synthase [Curvibacter sp. APW13]MDT8991373.1 pseudouridine synthase [Curvibacter sp. APW13]
MSRKHPRQLLVRPPARDGVAPSSLTTPPGHWPSLLAFLSERFAHVGMEAWRERLRAGDVLDAAGQPLSLDALFTPNQRLFYYREVAAEPEPREREVVLFQDAHLVVADKPHSMPVTPSGKYVRQTLLARLRARLNLPELSPLHRIDLDTAGLVLFSVNPAERNAYQALFRDRTVHKTYEAIARWDPTLPWPLRRESRLEVGAHFMQQAEVAGEVNAITTITPIEHAHGWARYRLEPLSGQRHQLRAHMAALGLPLLGDGIYPVLTPEGHSDPDKPLQLLAREIAIDDPVTGEARHFTSQRRLLDLADIAGIFGR